MKSNEYAHWLNGFFQLSQTKSLTDKQLNVIKKELTQVFKEDSDPNSFCVELRSVFEFDENLKVSEQFTVNLQNRLQTFLKQKQPHVVKPEIKNDRPRFEAMC